MHVSAAHIQRWWRAGRGVFWDSHEPARPPHEPGVAVLGPERLQELPLYHVAALEIQRAVRRTSPGIAARRLQRWARRIAEAAEQKSVFTYFRDLCGRFQRNCTPIELLRVVNPREAGLADAASDLGVMLRLGGASFPPGVYYKVSTGAAVCDVGAFAPRRYATERQTRRDGPAPPVAAAASAASAEDGEGSLRVGSSSWKVRVPSSAGSEEWYERWENNGWRPVAVKTLAEAEMDPVAKATAARRVPWHWSKLKRREDKAARRRERKRQWLQKLYAEGLARERDGVTPRRGADTTAPFSFPSTERPSSAVSDASWASSDLRGLTQAELQAAAERSVRARLGLAEREPLSVDAFLARVLEEEEDDGEEADDGDGAGSKRRAGEAASPGQPASGWASASGSAADACPVDFEAKDWEEQADSLLEWAGSLDPDAYSREWGLSSV